MALLVLVALITGWHVVMVDAVVVKSFEDSGLYDVPAPNEIPANTQDLNLNRNWIEVIPPGALSHLTALETLRLYDNNIERLPDLIDVAVTLKTLDLQNNNIAFMDRGLWSALKTVVTFNGTSNNLEEFPDMAAPGALVTVKVGSNNIKEFPDLPNIGVTLEHLYLEDNHLMTVPADLLKHLVKIKYLSINNNWISQMPDVSTIKGSLTTLDLSNNSMIPSAARLLDYAGLQMLDLDVTRGQILPPLGAQAPGMMLNVRTDYLDLCHCDHLWLKRANETGTIVNVKDMQCKDGGKLWSEQSFDEFVEDCFTYWPDNCTSMKKKMELVRKGYFASLDTLPVIEGATVIDCVRKCHKTEGCQSFNYKAGTGSNRHLGSCIIISPQERSGGVTVNDEQDWDYYGNVEPRIKVGEIEELNDGSFNMDYDIDY